MAGGAFPNVWPVNLAIQDIRHGLARFALTVFGVSMLVTATVGMQGMYRGIVFEALLIIESIGADLWVAEGGRSGPFAEPSSIPANLDRRVAGVQGVATARRFTNFNQQYEILGRTIRLSAVGIDFPTDTGDWIPLIAGRNFNAQHYEAIVDRTSGLAVGEVIRLHKNDYTIVGLTSGQVDMAGDPMIYLTIQDAQEAGFLLPSEAVLLNRQAKGRFRMGMPNNSGITAVAVTLDAGADIDKVKEIVSNWGDVTVLTRQEQHDMLLGSRLYKLRLQILAFTTMTLVICCAVIALTIYNMTVEKTRQIALLKLLGARDWLIAQMILMQALIIGVASFILGVTQSFIIFPYFPRTVRILSYDLAWIGAVFLALSLFASWFAIRKAVSIRAQEVLS